MSDSFGPFHLKSCWQHDTVVQKFPWQVVQVRRLATFEVFVKDIAMGQMIQIRGISLARRAQATATGLVTVPDITMVQMIQIRGISLAGRAQTD